MLSMRFEHHHPSGAGVEGYCELLAQELRLRHASEERVADVVAQVLSHVRDTGEDPVDAFGQPAAYAAQYVPAAVGWRRALPFLTYAVGLLGVFVALRGLLSIRGQVAVLTSELLVWGWLPFSRPLARWSGCAGCNAVRLPSPVALLSAPPSAAGPARGWDSGLRRCRDRSRTRLPGPRPGSALRRAGLAAARRRRG